MATGIGVRGDAVDSSSVTTYCDCEPEAENAGGEERGSPYRPRDRLLDQRPASNLLGDAILQIHDDIRTEGVHRVGPEPSRRRARAT